MRRSRNWKAYSSHPSILRNPARVREDAPPGPLSHPRTCYAYCIHNDLGHRDPADHRNRSYERSSSRISRRNECAS